MKNNYWQDLKNGLMEHVEKLGIQPRYFKDYSRSMDVLMEYAAENECSKYSPEIGFSFW